MKRTGLIILLALLVSVVSVAQPTSFVPHTVIVKIDENAYSAKGKKMLTGNDLSSLVAVKQMETISSYARKNSAKGVKSVLDGIYKITLKDEVEENSFLAEMAQYANVLYAEAYPNVFPLEVPNDPQAILKGPQYHLGQIKAYDAWNSTRGKEEIIIGIIDTGIDLDHEDLAPNLYVNTAELIDGIDNDNDGYIDNYYGWDLADNDNLPEADTDEHGTLVAGIAAAATNNAIGIAGVGYRTKIMPIKIFKSGSAFSYNSYEGIIYAADQGCDIINLSWGSVSGYSQYAQDVINYAALERDVVIVAAAGNTNALLDFYPASYDNVLSVGFVDRNDQKAANSTYSYMMDLVAPGIDIYTTKNNDTYGTDGGSSLASPMVAGAAALIKAFRPSLSAVEIMEQLRVNTDVISTIGNNADYPNQLGSGRLNIFKAINNEGKPAVRITDFSYDNGFESAAYYGDTLNLRTSFKNHLAGTEDLTITLLCDNPYVEVLNNTVQIGQLNGGASYSNFDNPLRIVLAEDIPEQTIVYLKYIMEGAFYDDYQVVKLVVNLRDRTFDFGPWSFTLSSTANFGLNAQSPYGVQQLTYNGINILKHQGLVIAASPDSVSKNIAFAPLFNQYQEDFEAINALKRFKDIRADLDIRSEFTESTEISAPLGIEIRQRLLAWQAVADQQYLLLTYDVINSSSKIYDSLYFSFLNDWAVNNADGNVLAYDVDNNLSYVTDTEGSIYAGFAGITAGDSSFYALDLADYNGHTSNLLNDTLNNQLLWDYLSSTIRKDSAGRLAGGNNVAGLHGQLIRDFIPGEIQSYNFVLATANSLADLQNIVQTAKTKALATENLLPFGAEIQLCSGDEAIFSVNNDSIYLYDAPLALDPVLKGKSLLLGSITADSLLYYEVIDARGISSSRKRLLLSVVKPVANFTVESEPYLLTPGKTNFIKFEDLSLSAVNRRWTFSHGYESTQQLPEIPFTSDGTVSIELIAENAIGCTDTLQQNINLVWRAVTPNINDVWICRGENISLSDPAIGEIVVYADSLAKQELFRGEQFQLQNVQQEAVYYVRNEQGDYPSVLKKVQINILAVEASFTLATDMSSASEVMQAIAVNTSNSSAIQWLLNGDFYHETDTIYIPLNELTSDNLQLVATNDFGCTDTLTYQGVKSENPLFEPYFLCRGEIASISATNSDSLFFYADDTLDSFLGKGSVLNLSAITESTQVYAVNVAAVIPSDVVKVPLMLSSLSADFNINLDTINLAYDQQAFVQALDETASNFIWDLGDGRELMGREVSFTYASPGVYQLELTVQDSLGCSASKSLQLVVFDDPILGSTTDLKQFFNVFPNPANQVLHLEGSGDFTYDRFEIVDVKGQIVMSNENNKPSLKAEVINVNSLQEGIYFLVVRKGKFKASFMFMVKR